MDERSECGRRRSPPARFRRGRFVRPPLLRYEGCAARSLRGLNAGQGRAILALVHGAVAAIAGAGTGKTKMLVHAAAYLVEKGLAKAPQILMLTFTCAAARQMTTRVTKLMPPGTSGTPWAGTFHAFGVYLLRRYGGLADLPEGFSVIDRADTTSIIKRAIKELNLEERALLRPGRIVDLISAAVNRRRPLAETIERQAPEYVPVIEELEAIRDWYAAYKTERQLLDFDDLLERTVALLERNDALLRRLRELYRWILVDEGQDLNGLQARMVDLLAGDSGRVMQVGDDAQAIYGWRGADPKNIQRFSRTHDAAVVPLEQNYRSTQPILDVANALNAKMSEAFTKTLVAVRDGGQKPLLLETAGDTEEAKLVADMIAELVDGGESLEEIAVLFRKSRDSIWLELELDRRRVPYVKLGGLRFKECAHVKDIVAHLRLVMNPTDELAWMRVLQLCPGVGPKTARKIYEATQYTQPSALAVRDHAGKGKSRHGLEALADLLEDIAVEGQTPSELTEKVASYYLKVLAVNLPEHRLKDIDRLINIAQGYGSLADMLVEFTLEAPDRHGGDGGEDHPRLVLSTVHSAKGLEWNHVFVIHAQIKSYPAARAEDVAEERRLLYVAVTRARDGLYITVADVLSPFLQQLRLGELVTLCR